MRAGTLAVLLVAGPVVAGVVYSLLAATGLAGAGADGFTTVHLTRTLADPVTWRAVLWTMYTAGTATVLAAAAALLVAVRVRDSAIGRRMATATLAVPYAAAGLAALLLFSGSGLLARLAFTAGLIDGPGDFPALVYDRPGVALILAFAWKEFPFLALVALAVADTLGSTLDETARTLGADPRARFRRVTAPLLLRGIAPAAIAGFAYLLGQYELAVMLAPSDPSPLAVLTYERATDPDLARRGDAHVLGLLATAICLVLVALHERARGSSEPAREERPAGGVA